MHPLLAPADGAATGYVPFNERPLSGHGLLLRLVPPAGRVLDVGCSSGYLARRLAARGSSVVGLELDPTAAAAAREFCEDVLVGDIESLELPFERGSFDAVVCGDLIEHLRDPGAFLARVRPLLRPGGRLVLSTPNVANWSIRLLLLLGRFDYTDRGILDRTHLRFFTRRTLLECVRSAGYEIQELDFTAPVPLLGRIAAVERAAHAIAALRPTLFAFQWVVAASPRESSA